MFGKHIVKKLGHEFKNGPSNNISTNCGIKQKRNCIATNYLSVTTYI